LKQLLNEEQLIQAQTEYQDIYNKVAPNFLAKIVNDYAVNNPNDSQVPKALHLVVEATHYAQCKDEETTEYSRKAFQLLHNYYPNNYWTNQTPYWY